MAEPVHWAPDGTPSSPRFGDVYRARHGGLAQARHVFLEGCGLPAAWAGQQRWRILETGFGLGLNFLATWQAWRDDPARPAMLHFASVEAHPVAAEDILRGARDWPELEPLAQQLAQRCWGLVPGFHRLAFEDGHVLLTLCVGDALAMLRECAFDADSVFLDGFDPVRNPAMWQPELLAEVARRVRPGARLATWTVAGAVRRELEALGFALAKRTGLPPKRECLQGTFAPTAPATLRPDPTPPRRVAVIGAGLAGAAMAASLARRGADVVVLDERGAAQGASALPAGLLAPHTSGDDALLSRLTRAGVRVTLQEAARLLREGESWLPSGALEVRPQPRPLPDLGDAQQPWQARAMHGDLPAIRHDAAAWIQPAALVGAWLSQQGIRVLGDARVTRMAPAGSGWRLDGDDGRTLTEADLVVVAAALGSDRLLPATLPLQPVRGQVSWSLGDGPPAAAQPLNGNGHFLPDVPLPGGRGWLTGSTYARGDQGLEPREADHAANLERLRRLDAAIAAAVAPAFHSGRVQAWIGVRCASADRRPLVGEVLPGCWVSTAMGSRGLTFATLCAELVAARVHGEPWPLPVSLAAALDVHRVLGAPVPTR